MIFKKFDIIFNTFIYMYKQHHIIIYIVAIELTHFIYERLKMSYLGVF
jgi:hypothetical protein